MPSSKRTSAKEEKTKIYCRKCMRSLSEGKFYKAADHFLDSNGHMSICSECIADMYHNFYSTDTDISRTIYRMCKILNIQYNEGAVDSAKRHVATMEGNGKTVSNPFGIYKTKLLKSQKTSLTNRDMAEDFTFEEITPEVREKLQPNGKTEAELMYFWGGNPNLIPDDYVFLERELSEYQMSNVCDTKQQLLLFKNVCIKTLEIRKARVKGQSDSSLLTDLTKLMKMAGIDPSNTKTANSGKHLETWGVFAKMVETEDPADHYKDRDLYKDWFGIGDYYNMNIGRSIKNWITGSRDFPKLDDVDDGLFEEE